MISFTYPDLPPKEFSRNSRVHWSTIHRVQDQVADDIYLLLRESGWTPGTPLDSAVVSIEFVVPDKRVRDADNLITSSKPIMDALVTHGVIKDDSLAVIGIPEYSYRYADDKKAVTNIRII